MEQAVHDFVDRAVTAEGHDEIDVVGVGGPSSKVPGVPAVLRGHRLQLHLAGQRMDEHVTGPRTGGGSSWIDHKECAHDGQTTYHVVPV